MSASSSMKVSSASFTKKVSRMSTRFRSRRSTISGSISSISKSCKLKRPTFKPWIPGSQIVIHNCFSVANFRIVRTNPNNSNRSGHPCFKRPTFKRKKPVHRVPSIRDAFDEMCRSHIMDFVLVSYLSRIFSNFDVISWAPYHSEQFSRLKIAIEIFHVISCIYQDVF